MKLITEAKINQRATKSFDYTFDIKTPGLYVIEIKARAKSWLQNTLRLISFFKDDDLAVAIDGIKFSKLSKKGGFFDSEVAWNGNLLKNLQQINVLIIYLKPGAHLLSFLVDQSPFIEEIKIYQAPDRAKIVFETDNNYQAEDGNRRPWLNFILVNLPLKNMFVRARADKRNADDDDLQLRINGQRQINDTPKSHRYWYWCGRTLKGETKIFKKEVHLVRGIHYIEFWADQQPFIEQIVFERESKSEFGREPTVDDPQWTGDFSDDSEQMILARAIWGEARGVSKQARIAVAWSIRNRLGVRGKWGTYHSIILDPAQYSAFWEKPSNDANLQALRDPLGTTSNPADHQKWHETYEIAGQVMRGEIYDPTDGANHYYDDSIRPPSWTKSGKLKLKIGSLNFYYAK